MKLKRIAPTPWEVERTAQEVPPSRLTATVYAADSTRICETKGPHAVEIAQLIADAVNNYTPRTNDTP
jgi:hypothetical protein